MPGTVRITVLEVVDLPGPSGKKYAVQVSVGARSFSTDEQASTSSGSGTSSIKAFNSDFAFAVLNLTDPVVFTLLDARGVAVCKTSLSVPSVVEKGFRDDMLPWSNGGQVHVKSNFMLSDEERAKIAAMRARSMSKRKDGSSSGTVTPIASGTVTPRTVSAVLASPVASAAPAASETSTATEAAAASTTEVTAATTTTTTTTTTVTTSTTATTETAAAGTVAASTATSTVSAAAQKESVAVTAALPGSAAAGAPVDMSNVMMVFDGSDDESGYTESSLEESVSAQVAPAAPAAPVAAAAVPAAASPAVPTAVPDSVPEVAPASVSQAAQAVQVQDPDSIATATVEVVKEVQKEVQVSSAQQTASTTITKTDVTIIKTATQVASEATTMSSAKVASVSTSTKTAVSAAAASAGASVQAAMSSTTGRASEQSSVRGGGGVAADLNGRVGSSSRQPAVADSEAAESSWESGDEVESMEGSSVSGTTDREVVRRGKRGSSKGRNHNGGLLGQVLRVGDGLTPVMKQVLGTGAFMLAMVALWPRPQKQSRVQLETDADGKVWVVKPGETLSSILPREVYCNPSSKFFELNPEVCDINRIYSGQRLVLP